MQIRTAILVAGATLAIAAPAASASIPWEPSHADTATAVVPTTENSYGQSKSTDTFNGVKLPHAKVATAAKTKASSKASASHVVTYIVEPMLPASSVAAAPDPNACDDTGSNCTDEQLCSIWGMNCGASAQPTSAN